MVSEQRAIATALSDADALIESLDRLIAKKRAIKQAAMQQLLTGQTRLPGFEGEWHIPPADEEATGTASAEEVPPGYKRTEVGVIPEDWEARKIGELTQIKRGASPRPIADSKWFDAKSDVGWLRISDVAREGKYIKATDQSLSEAGVSRSRLVMPGNVIMSMAATIGRPTINHKTVCIHDGFVVFDKPSISPEFFYYLLRAIEDRWSERGQTGSQVNLNTHLIGSTYVPLPINSNEQIAIATVLSDMDTEIETLERRRDKARQIKQGMMQELLTGRVRLVNG